MTWFPRKFFAKIIESKHALLLFFIVFVVYMISSFDVCWFFGGENGIGINSGFVFSSSWSEHLHSSEGWSIYYQVKALYEGRVWISQGAPPAIGVDFFGIGDYYYSPFEPLVAIMLLPFYALGNSLVGSDYLICSVITGMIFYTSVSALLVRKISLQLGQKNFVANIAALIFAFATMAFSYSHLIYPQPIFTMMSLATLLFLFRYMKKQDTKNLLFFSLFFCLTVNTFNTFIIATPFFLYFLLKKGLFAKKENLRTIGVGLIPGILLFLSWNFLITGNPIMTPRQVEYPSMNFEFLYQSTGGVLLNVEGLIGSLFSPVGIFFVSPILLASFIGFSSLNRKAKDETNILVLLIVIFWIFISFANLGGATGRDFWLGGWANIARYIFFSSSLLVVFTAEGIEKIGEHKSLLGAWIISLVTVLSVLANFTYGVRHDLMVAHLTDFTTNSLMIWPYPLGSSALTLFFIVILSVSAIYPLYLIVKKKWNFFEVGFGG
jgi:hypothetical protein